MIQENNKIIKIEVKQNYIITDFENPPKNKILKYARKEIIDKHGNRNLLTLAVIKNPDGTTKTVATSFWRPIKSKSGKKILRYYLKNHRDKVHFTNDDLKKKYLQETTFFNSKSILLFLKEVYYV